MQHCKVSFHCYAGSMFAKNGLLSSVPDSVWTEIEALPRADRCERLKNALDLTPRDLARTLAESHKLPFLETPVLADNPTVILPKRIIHAFQCLPLADISPQDDATNRDNLRLLTLWPPDQRMNQWIRAATGRMVEWCIGPADFIGETITQQFGVGDDSLDDDEVAEIEPEEAAMEEDADAAVIRFVNEIIHRATQDRATDIHFEPLRDSLQIRYRIDGNLVSIRLPDNLVRFQDAIISRLKIMAKLNISEKRRPQDGRIGFGSGDTEMDIRISTFPTLYGESISLRLLTQKSAPISMRELGLSENESTAIARSLTSPHGIILVTGPTGSGKSTSLTAFIRTINRPERRIITVEDPVEYEVPGVNQTQIKPEIGLTFATALRHVLRQDPDVIMVGEIRDRETADIAIRASLTGHLVLSTLHTNDAPGALTRLIDMEIEPFLIASSVEMIIAQRLVRRLCAQCSQPAGLEHDFGLSCLTAMGIDRVEVDQLSLARKAVGCESCRNIGYRGRIGMFEILRVDDALHELIVQRASSRVIRQAALRNGMRSLMQSGWEQIKLGRTTFEEVMRYAEPDDLETEANHGN
jgi:general secretion pathway protein E